MFICKTILFLLLIISGPPVTPRWCHHNWLNTYRLHVNRDLSCRAYNLNNAWGAEGYIINWKHAISPPECALTYRKVTLYYIPKKAKGKIIPRHFQDKKHQKSVLFEERLPGGHYIRKPKEHERDLKPFILPYTDLPKKCKDCRFGMTLELIRGTFLENITPKRELGKVIKCHHAEHNFRHSLTQNSVLSRLFLVDFELTEGLNWK